MADNKQIAIQEGGILDGLMRTDGWEVLERLIHTQITDDTNRLTQATVKELADVRFLQGRIDGCRQILTKVQYRIKAFREA